MNRDIRIYVASVALGAVAMTLAGFLFLRNESSRRAAENARACAAGAKAAALAIEARLNADDGGGHTLAERLGEIAETEEFASAAFLWHKGSGAVWKSGALPAPVEAMLAPDAKWRQDGGKSYSMRHGINTLRHGGGTCTVAWARLGPADVAGLVFDPDGGAAVPGLSLYVLEWTLFLSAAFAVMLAAAVLLWRAAGRARADARMKTDFVSLVGHELRTPFASILPNLEMLLDGTVSAADDRREVLASVREECVRLRNTLERLIAYSKTQAARRRFAKEPFDLAALARETCAAAAPRFPHDGLHFRAPAPLHVLSDPGAVREILENLLDNALKYAAADGPVDVSAGRAADGLAAIRVEDRGPGVAPEHRKDIFKSFWRADDALSRSTEGLGIGLPFARSLAHGLGGSLRFEPRRGGGAAFVLEIPEGGEHGGNTGG